LKFKNMRIFSGIRPTGELHIGNYFGAMKQGLKLQEKNECFFSIVDLHAVTTPYQKELLQKNILELMAAFLAAGLDPEKCTIFVQSQIKEHTELAWILGTICPVGELKRMTQFKEKVKKYSKNINAGLLNYPLLMASDILLYRTDLVPVGKDQKQHVELTQFLAEKFNKKFGTVFKIPKPLIPKAGAKVMSLQNPKKKMSKTDDPEGCLGLFDTPEEIERKIKIAVTDSGKEVKYDLMKKPGISNLLTIYSLFSGKSIKDLEKKFSGLGYEKFKKSLTELVVESLKPFREKRNELLKREVFLKEILERGRKRAQIVARSMIDDVKREMGLV